MTIWKTEKEMVGWH